MRILVISDIHANYPALEAVLASVVTVDAVWCLGDLVGYGPFPNECIERVAELPNLSCLMGNHDSAIADNANIDKFNDEASNAIYWTKRVITDKNLAFLRSLPETVKTDWVTMAHGSPRMPTWEYLIDPLTALVNFAFFETQVALVGHSHLPLAFIVDKEGQNINRTICSPGNPIKIETRAIFNPGSVGQPRDHDPRAAYGILDPEEQTWEIKRVPYNIETTQKAIEKAGLPMKLSVRLAEGW
jgi:diadenosine tetraphosphatase ApaH/serine/threonine PP2A family protein phosphatase